MSTHTLPMIGEIEISRRERLIAVVAALAVILVFPQVAGDYWTSVGITMIIVSLFALSFNLLFGYAGLLSFGHSAFYGFSAYVVALSLAGAIPGLPQVESFLIAVALAIVLTTIMSGVMGALCVQRGGIFFAMLTLALSMMLYEIALHWKSVTSGDDGTTLLAPPVDLGVVTFNTLHQNSYYYFSFIIVAVCVYGMYRLVKSPYGELLLALRENPDRSEFVGVNVKFYQWTVFVLSGFFGAVAGALISVQNFVVSPIMLHWSTSAIPVLATLIGGPTAFFGPIVGSIIFVLLEEGLTSITQHWQIGIGLILIPIVLFFPGGIVGTLSGEGGLLDMTRSRQEGEENA